MTLEEIQAELDKLKKETTVRFAYKKRRMLRWQPLAITGMDPEEAKQFAEANDMYYEAKWLMYSTDNGKTWLPVPPGKDIPVYD